MSVALIAALFHDLGKATALFQAKLERSLKGSNKPVADAARHELVSLFVWDRLFGDLDDERLCGRLAGLKPEDVEKAFMDAVDGLVRANASPRDPLGLACLRDESRLTFAVAALILTHHRLPGGDSALRSFDATAHVSKDSLRRNELALAPGEPVWREAWWTRALEKEAGRLRRCLGSLPEGGLRAVDLPLRASLMFADHMGSAESAPSGALDPKAPRHLAKTQKDERGKREPGDSLSRHTERVHGKVRAAFDMLHRCRGDFPYLTEGEAPARVLHPDPSAGRFAWQAEAARRAREAAAGRAGGFFACLIAGTGTGKTRAGATVLAAAAFADPDPRRRRLRASVALGLRVLAKQTAAAYVRDLGFPDRAVAALIGEQPLEFPEAEDDGATDGIDLPEWLQLERAGRVVPDEGSPEEEDWLRGLSSDPDRQLHRACTELLSRPGAKNPGKTRRFVETPVVVLTVDHLVAAVQQRRSRYLWPAVRLLTSDAIFDELDQHEPEDLAVLARLAFQLGAAGRRMVVMSATLPPDVASGFFEAYRAGWRCHAATFGVADAVNAVVAGDAPGCCFGGSGVEKIDFDRMFGAAVTKTVAHLAAKAPSTVASLLPPAEDWPSLLTQLDAACSSLHDDHHAKHEGFRVSVGLVRLTRVRHAAAVCLQLNAAPSGRLRVKVCLHARLPRVQRAWVERELGKALTRKGSRPDDGVVALCARHGVYDKARAMGATDVEVVVVATTVIETGNDLDFDWAVVDPVSVRSVVQSAGRVNRHRASPATEPNVAVLGRCLIVAEEGKLARPGVETPPRRDTGVGRVELGEDRSTAALFGRAVADGSPVDSRAALDPSVGSPLRSAEATQRGRMLRGGGVLDAYLGSATARLSEATAAARRFRASATKDKVYGLKDWRGHEEAWHVELAHGMSTLNAEERGLGLTVRRAADEGFLFDDPLAAALDELFGSDAEPSIVEVFRATSVTQPVYGDDNDFPKLCLAPQTGLTRGLWRDLSEPYGKSLKPQ